MKSIGGLESMKMSVKGQDYESNKNILKSQSELHKEPIGIYVEIDNQIDDCDFGFQIVLDKEDLLNPTDITIDGFTKGSGLSILKEFTIGYGRVKDIYKEMSDLVDTTMSMDLFWMGMVRDSLIGVMCDLENKTDQVSTYYDLMKKSYNVQGGFMIKVEIKPNDDPINDLMVEYTNIDFYREFDKWSDKVQLTMFSNEPMEEN